MMLDLFDQFSSPNMLGLPLMTIALLTPTALMYTNQRLQPSRLTATQSYIAWTFTKHLFHPINKPGHAWALMLLTTMAYLLMINLLGLLPHIFTPTTQLALNMGLAVPLWTMTVLLGLRTNPAASLAHMLPLGTPGPLIPALILIETVSLLIRPLALGVRLTANLTAGHLLMTLISLTALKMLSLAPPIAILTTTLLALLACLELAVAIIQAYVFTLLVSLYLQENT
uniref:ATP synthase subunit a n=1 Tax=Hemidactylus frenatus TaxID=47729 RepID=F1LKY2_HEMFR|nr:ATP synthase F0 subunit 6 [Hemidactylus frenatus]ACS37288.1 ATP synthase F0 subunit 6 [Hemidactylus frenatus]